MTCWAQHHGLLGGRCLCHLLSRRLPGRLLLPLGVVVAVLLLLREMRAVKERPYKGHLLLQKWLLSAELSPPGLAVVKLQGRLATSRWLGGECRVLYVFPHGGDFGAHLRRRQHEVASSSPCLLLLGAARVAAAREEIASRSE